MVSRRTNLVFILIALLIPGIAKSQGGIIAGVPSSLTVHEGQNFEITWFISPGNSPVSAVDFVLSYNPQEIEAIEILKHDSPLSIQPLKPSIDNAQGKIIYSAFKLDSPWPSQPFIFVGVRFKALAATAVTSLYHNLEELPNSTMAFEGKVTMKEARKVLIRILDSDLKPGSGSGNGSLTVVNKPQSQDEEDTTLQFTPSKSGNATVSLLSEKNQYPAVPLYTGQVISGVEYVLSIPLQVLPIASYKIELKNGTKSESVQLSR